MRRLRYSHKGPLEAERCSNPPKVNVEVVPSKEETMIVIVRKRGGSIEVAGSEKLQGNIYCQANILTSERYRVPLHSC